MRLPEAERTAQMPATVVLAHLLRPKTSLLFAERTAVLQMPRESFGARRSIFSMFK